MDHGHLAAYFGYGSLVNRLTLRTAYVSTHRARLAGWRRHWQSRGIDSGTPAGPIALLSVHRAPDSAIHGMLVIDRREHLAEVDLREAMYDRVPIRHDDLEHAGERPAAFPQDCHIYVGREAAEHSEPRLLQSYLDAVMAGFLAEFGEEGVRAFIATTDGWDRGIVADRTAPLYPRAVQVDAQTARSFDRLLEDAGVRFA